MARTPFKMKSSPTKGKLQDFFNTIGSQLKAGQKDRGIFSEAGKAEKKERRAGESKFKADIRRGKERRAKEKATEAETSAATLTNEEKGRAKGKDRKGYVVPPSTTPKDHRERLMKTFNLGKGDPYTYRYRLGDFEGDIGGSNIEFKTGDGDWTVANERQSKSIEESPHGLRNIKITSNQPSELYDTEDFTYDSPIDKKSPYKRGIGSYAKKAKGSRGYKMKKR